MKRYLLSTLLMIVCTIFAAQSQTTFTIDGVEYTQSTVSTVNITGFTGSAETLTLTSPITYNGTSYIVNSIAKNALSDADIKNLTISNIPSFEYAFQNNTNLESVTIGDGVVKISYGAFYGCTNLNTLIISSSDLQIIDSLAFANCTNLTGEIQLTSIKEINTQAFRYCTSPYTVTFGKNLTTIGFGAFSSSGITSFILPEDDNLAAISGYVFNGCSSLTGSYSFTNLETIGNSAFIGTAVTEIIVGNKLTTIGSNAFSRSSIASFDIPESVTSLGSSVFSSCKQLKNVTFPENGKFTSLPDYFVYSSGIPELIIPDYIESLGTTVYGNCSSLKKIQFPKNEKFTTIPADGNSCYNIETVIIPENVTTVADQAFMNNKIASIDLPQNGNITWGTSVFQNNLITEIEIPETYKTVPASMFAYNPLETITLHDGLESIEASAFASNSSKKTSFSTLTIPGTVTSIGESAFIGCQGLKTLIFELNEDDPYIDYTYGANAFGNYSNATVDIDEVQCWTPKAPTVATNTFSTQTYDNAKLIVSKDNRYSYEETPGWLLEPANGFLQFNTDKVLTGVEENIVGGDDEEIRVYDATGILRMQTNNPDDMNSLPRGLYIVNGKKVIL